MFKWNLASFVPALEMNDERFLLAAWNGKEQLLIFIPQRFTTNPEWKVRGSVVIASVTGPGPFPGSDCEFSSCSHRYLPSHYKLSRWKMNIFPPTILFPPCNTFFTNLAAQKKPLPQIILTFLSLFHFCVLYIWEEIHLPDHISKCLKTWPAPLNNVVSVMFTSFESFGALTTFMCVFWALSLSLQLMGSLIQPSLTLFYHFTQGTHDILHCGGGDRHAKGKRSNSAFPWSLPRMHLDSDVLVHFMYKHSWACYSTTNVQIIAKTI